MIPVERARKVLRQFKVTTPPTPVEEIAYGLGASISTEPLAGDISGMLYRKGDRKVIGVNGADSPNRQRFTIAHEIGHLLLHKGRPVIVDKLVRINLRTSSANMASPAEERQANAFAAELLMPEQLVRAEAQALVGDRDLVSDRWFVKELADRFQVSQQAMEYRLVNLDLMSRLALESGWT